VALGEIDTTEITEKIIKNKELNEKNLPSGKGIRSLEEGEMKQDVRSFKKHEKDFQKSHPICVVGGKDPG